MERLREEVMKSERKELKCLIFHSFVYIIGQRNIVYETLSALMSLRLLRILIQFKSKYYIYNIVHVTV